MYMVYTSRRGKLGIIRFTLSVGRLTLHGVYFHYYVWKILRYPGSYNLLYTKLYFVDLLMTAYQANTGNASVQL